MEGEISIFSIKREKRLFFQETIPAMVKAEYERRTLVKTDEEVDLNQIQKETSNVMYGCLAVKSPEHLQDHYLVGDEHGNTMKYTFDTTSS